MRLHRTPCPHLRPSADQHIPSHPKNLARRAGKQGEQHGRWRRRRRLRGQRCHQPEAGPSFIADRQGSPPRGRRLIQNLRNPLEHPFRGLLTVHTLKHPRHTLVRARDNGHQPQPHRAHPSYDQWRRELGTGWHEGGAPQLQGDSCPCAPNHKLNHNTYCKPVSGSHFSSFELTTTCSGLSALVLRGYKTPPAH